MAEVIQIASARGGAGATTCAFLLAEALTRYGDRTLIVDGDAESGEGLFVSGMQGLNVYTLADAAKGECRVKQAILQHTRNPNLYLLPTLGCNDGAFTERAVKESEGLFDYVLCDGCAYGACGKALVVTEPYLSSVKSADVRIARLKDGGCGQVGLIVNKINGGLVFDGEILTPQEIASVLRCELWGVIPEDLGLPLGRAARRTQTAFSMTAAYVKGKSDKVYGVIRPYAGLSGAVKRKLRRWI